MSFVVALIIIFFFFFNDTAPTEIYTLSLHDVFRSDRRHPAPADLPRRGRTRGAHAARPLTDRKSTRLNSSHSQISYAVFCLKKKKKHKPTNSDKKRTKTITIHIN